MFNIISNISIWIVPALLTLIPLYGYLKGVNVYESFIEGAEEGFTMSVKVLPFMVAIFVAIGIFRASGALAGMIHFLAPLLTHLGIPGQVVPLMLIRPLSGTAALAILADVLKTSGPDSFVGRLASILQGSTDTTFYVLAVYFGSVGIKRARYAITVGLIGDFAGFVASVILAHLIFH